MNYIIVTNNDRCWETYHGQYRVEFDENWSYLEVLTHVRDLVHRGAQLITHPMAGSLKPNQTPYRTVVLATQSLEEKEPWRDVTLMENSIESCEKFMRCRALPHWPPRIQEDFKTLDLSFIVGALASARAQGGS